MEPDPGHVEAAALRDYVESVAELLRVEPAASWSEYGSPTAAPTAYIALGARRADRFPMLSWTGGSKVVPRRGGPPGPRGAHRSGTARQREYS